MADEQGNPADLRIPVRVTIPWMGKMTRGGQPWPLDQQGRYWPSSRWGDPVRPLDEYPPDMPAPGTGPRLMTIDDAVRLSSVASGAENAVSPRHNSGAPQRRTVTPGGVAAQGFRATSGHDAAANRAARLGLITVVLGVAAAEAETLGIVAALETAGAVVTAVAETVVAVASAPVILGALTAAAVGAILLKVLGKEFVFETWREAHAFLSNVLHEPHLEGFDPAALPPLQPAPAPPPVVDGVRNPGFVPPTPSPAQPGFTPAPPRPLVPPVAPPHPPIGMVMESRNRNKGLEGGARTYSPRARGAARNADPNVVRHLTDDEWEAHHLINIAAIRVVKDLVAAAVKAGWRTDGKGNIAAVPHSAEAREKLRAAGVRRPLHDNRHSEWNKYVEKQLVKIEQKIEEIRFNNDDSKNAAVKREFDKLEIRLRRRMKRVERITSIESDDDVKSI